MRQNKPGFWEPLTLVVVFVLNICWLSFVKMLMKKNRRYPLMKPDVYSIVPTFTVSLMVILESFMAHCLQLFNGEIWTTWFITFLLTGV